MAINTAESFDTFFRFLRFFFREGRTEEETVKSRKDERRCFN